VRTSGPLGLSIAICGRALRIPAGSSTGGDHDRPSVDLTDRNGVCRWSGYLWRDLGEASDGQALHGRAEAELRKDGVCVCLCVCVCGGGPNKGG
jgi:hypothetical protein